MTPKKPAEGEYELVVPLDYKLLEELPVEGTMLADLYEIGSTVKEIQKKYPALHSGSIARRLSTMMRYGLTRKVRIIGRAGNSGTFAWQRTHKADKLLSTWKKENHANG